MAMVEDQLSLDMQKMLDNLATAQSNHSISRVCDRLRSLNENAFDPKIIAIGPLHRDKPHLQSMELHKVRYLKSFLQKSCINSYVTAIRGLQEEARKCYAEKINLGNDDEFVRMLLLDGVFILQFLRKYYSKHVKNQDDVDDRSDVVFHFQHTLIHLLHDLILFENQIPLSVIKQLFKMSKINDEEQFVDLIWPLVQTTESDHSESRVFSSLKDCNAPHLLGLVHHAKYFPLSDLNHCPYFSVSQMNDMNSATEMHEAGIIFKKATNPPLNSTKGNSFLNIKFENRTMRIQPLLISNETESWFRNMIAYEDGFQFGGQKYITDYIFFMHCLIRSPRDVKLLRNRGIIGSWTGGDDYVYQLIKQLENEIDLSENFTYANVVVGATKHCKHRRNKWMAILRQNYFDSPWKFISFVAAVTLLLLTAVQTAFAILSYRDDE